MEFNLHKVEFNLYKVEFNLYKVEFNLYKVEFNLYKIENYTSVRMIPAVSSSRLNRLNHPNQIKLHISATEKKFLAKNYSWNSMNIFFMKKILTYARYYCCTYM